MGSWPGLKTVERLVLWVVAGFGLLAHLKGLCCGF